MIVDEWTFMYLPVIMLYTAMMLYAVYDTPYTMLSDPAPQPPIYLLYELINLVYLVPHTHLFTWLYILCVKGQISCIHWYILFKRH